MNNRLSGMGLYRALVPGHGARMAPEPGPAHFWGATDRLGVPPVFRAQEPEPEIPPASPPEVVPGEEPLEIPDSVPVEVPADQPVEIPSDAPPEFGPGGRR